MTPSHKGGTRSPRDLFENLTVLVTQIQGTCILVDDVMTSGGHFLAAAAGLSTICKCDFAVCVGRTTAEGNAPAFSVMEDTIRNFSPGKRRALYPFVTVIAVVTLKKKVAMSNNLIHEQPNEPLANYLRAHRRKSGLTQDELAESSTTIPAMRSPVTTTGIHTIAPHGAEL